MFKCSLFHRATAISLLAASALTWGETVIQFTPLENTGDKRLEYPLKVIDLAMSKTSKKYGIHKLTPIPQAISLARSIYELNRGTYSNYFFPGGTNIEEMSKGNLIKVDYPLDHGLLSYRICFVSPTARTKVAAVNTVADLQKFSIAQGTNWLDVSILQNNGFRVIENQNYMGLFKMVISGRADLFCRGLSELHKEYDAYKSLGDLQYDDTFVLVYPLPYSLYFNRNSKPVIKRIEEGLDIAKKDGSLDALFNDYYRDDIVFAKLKQRKFFYLHSPYGQSLSPTYKSYLIDPLKFE